MNETTIAPECPSCNRAFRPVCASNTFAEEFTRTCLKCGERWRLLIKPVRSTKAWSAHSLTMTFIDNSWTRAAKVRKETEK